MNRRAFLKSIAGTAAVAAVAPAVLVAEPAVFAPMPAIPEYVWDFHNRLAARIEWESGRPIMLKARQVGLSHYVFSYQAYHSLLKAETKAAS